MAVQAHVHQLAVAAGDVYVRMYDRRMLSTGGPWFPPRCLSACLLHNPDRMHVLAFHSACLLHIAETVLTC